MIAVGGAISTDLSIASGAIISQADPGGALVTHALTSITAWLAIQSFDGIATYLPVPGSFQEYNRRYVLESFGFAMGQSYQFNQATTVTAELVAAVPVMCYWFPDVPSIAWSMLFLTILFGLNTLFTRVSGEGEFWFAIIKAIATIVFLVLNVSMALDILGGPFPGFEN